MSPVGSAPAAGESPGQKSPQATAQVGLKGREERGRQERGGAEELQRAREQGKEGGCATVCTKAVSAGPDLPLQG